MSRLRVLLVISSDSRRGAETQAIQVMEELRRFGLEATAVALAPGSGDGPRLDVTSLGRRQLGVSTIWRLRRLAKSFDVTVAFGSRTLPATALALAWTNRAWVYRNIGDPVAWQRGRAQRMRTGTLMRRATAVFSLWAGAASAIQRDYRVPHSKIRVVPNSRSSDEFFRSDSSDRAEARDRFGLPPNEVIIAFVGALSEEKRPELAIETVALLPNIHLAIAGDGNLRANCERLANLRAPDRVHFLGSLRDIARLYHAVDAVLLTSRTEGMPGVLIEAGFSEIPVVSTDVGAVRDIVIPGVTGIIVSDGNPEALAGGVREALKISPTERASARAHCLKKFEREVIALEWIAALNTVSRQGH